MKKEFSIVHLIAAILSFSVGALIFFFAFGSYMVSGFTGSSEVLGILAAAEGFLASSLIAAAIFCIVYIIVKKKIFSFISMLFFAGSLLTLPYYNYQYTQLSSRIMYMQYITPSFIYFGMIFAIIMIVSLIISLIYNFKKYKK